MGLRNDNARFAYPSFGDGFDSHRPLHKPAKFTLIRLHLLIGRPPICAQVYAGEQAENRRRISVCFRAALVSGWRVGGRRVCLLQNLQKKQIPIASASLEWHSSTFFNKLLEIE